MLSKAVGMRAVPVALTVAGMVLLGACSDTGGTAVKTRSATGGDRESSAAAGPVDGNAVSVPIPGGDWRAIAGTISRNCDADQLTTVPQTVPQVFDLESGNIESVSYPAVPAGETFGRITCSIARSDMDVRVIFLVWTTEPASGVEGEKIRTRIHSVPLDSAATPEVRELTTGALPFSLTMLGADRGVLLHSSAGVQALDPGTLEDLWSRDGSPMTPVGDKVAVSDSNTRVLLDIATGDVVEDFPDPHQLGDSNVLQFGYLWGDRVVPANGAEPFSIDSNSTWTGGQQLMSDEFFVSSLEDELLVYNVHSGEQVYSKVGDDAKALNITGLSLFGNHLYMSSSAGEDLRRSVVELPGMNEVSSSWSAIPTVPLSGWTLVSNWPAGGSPCWLVEERELRGCSGLTAVKDVDGEFPGPWT